MRSPTEHENQAALGELRRILGARDLQSFGDKAFHKVYEALFQLARSLRSKHVDKKTNSRSRTSNILASCAKTLLLAVDKGVRKIRIKTVRALVDHVVQTLPIAGEGWCEPLKLPYIQCLKTVLSYQPHVEHLLKDDWIHIVDFCVEALGRFCDEMSTPNTQSASETASFRTLTGSSRTSRQRKDEVAIRQRAPEGTTQPYKELISCLRQLTIAPNAPVLSRGEDLGLTLIAFLRVPSKSAGIEHIEAFATLSSILAHIVVDAVSLTKMLVAQLLSLIKIFWERARRLSSLKSN